MLLMSCWNHLADYFQFLKGYPLKIKQIELRFYAEFGDVRVNTY